MMSPCQSRREIVQIPAMLPNKAENEAMISTITLMPAYMHAFAISASADHLRTRLAPAGLPMAAESDTRLKVGSIYCRSAWP